KVVRSTKKVKAHDEENTAGIGDRVVIMETRPLSATKRWRLVRSEEHTSELQSRENLVCRLLLEKKKGPEHGLRTGEHPLMIDAECQLLCLQYRRTPSCG